MPHSYCLTLTASLPQVADEALLKPWQLAREKYKQRKRATGGREKVGRQGAECMESMQCGKA